MLLRTLAIGSLALTALVFACNSADIVQPSSGQVAPTSPTALGDDDDASPAGQSRDGSTTSRTDDASTSDEAGTPGDDDDDPPPPPPMEASAGDGTATRQQCTSTFGAALSTGHGRMDGYLVSIVAPTTVKGCNADSDHVHLQVKINGAIYDVAVNVDGVLTKELGHALLDGAWSEGWHPGDDLDFVNDLSLHDGDFTSITKTAAVQQVQSFLANANHVSVFATGYGTDGAHLVHRNGNGNDGALIINPLSANPQYLVFHFPGQTF